MSSSANLYPANTSLARRRYPLRRSPPSRKRAISSRVNSLAGSDALRNPRLLRDLELRPVLVPLHPNLRRLPSRILLEEKAFIDIQDSEMNARVGSKRKRVASGSNENAQSGRRSARAPSSLKRLKSSRRSDATTSDEDEISVMNVDAESSRWPASQSKESSPEPDSDDHVEEDEDEGVEEDDSSDDYLISSAPSRVLNRLRKDDLIRLYTLAGLSDDAESLTKSDIIDSIISARDDLASLPPSSPLGRGTGSSDYSSDDAMVPEDNQDEEPTPQLPNYLRRRATTNGIGHASNGRPLKSRSLSMGHLVGETSPSRSRAIRRHASSKSGEGSSSSGPKRQKSRSSPATSGSTSTSSHSDSLKSPPAHYLRSRKISAPTLDTVDTVPFDSRLLSSGNRPGSGAAPTTALAELHIFPKANNSKGKGKAKQVEFDNAVPTVSNGHTNGRSLEAHDSESDLTELEELEAQLAASRANPSPRRLRSRDKLRSAEGKEVVSSEKLDARRVTPMRKAKKNMKNLKEDDDDTSELSALDDEVEEEEEDDDDDEGEDIEGVQEDEDNAEEDEVDELVSSASATPPASARSRRPSLRRRLRPRKRAHVDPSDGDDEEEEDVAEDVEEDIEEDDNGEGEEDEEMEVEDDDDEATIAVEPRKLRNGKIVGEDDAETLDEEETGEEEEDGIQVDDESVDDESVDLDAEGETDEEVMEDEDSIDLTVATAKTLVRLRRDDLVRLCESRDLEPVGTKPQLAEALLQWRDRHTNDFSSPSSTGTARPPSTVRRRHRHRLRNESRKTASPPVLLRSERVHLDEPRTPPISGQNEKAPEPELELDLGTLGLEDREIPPEKLQKLEKIGSGGFKDVFIGKFKGRRIAISEFRGQLSAMDIKELKLLGGFDHPNIVRFLGVSIPENTRETPVMIVSELCTNGDLFDYIRNVHHPSLRKVLSIMLDIARGLEYLHLRKPSVIHRDCKSSNILITSKGTAKIADFGLAKVKQSTRSMVRSLVGTVNWQAPELWHAHPKYNHKVDVFSCACVFWEMLQWHLPNKKFPWEGMNEHAIYEIVGTKRQRPSLTGLRKQWCPEIVDLIERMWAQDHQDRPTMTEVVVALEELVTTY